MSACGDSGNTNPTLTFNTSAPEQYDINKFKDADYLYESYFGEFNLPASFKDDISVELKMVANGFALAEAKGEDVAQKMKSTDTLMREMFGTREMQEEIEMNRRGPEILQPTEDVNTTSTQPESEISVEYEHDPLAAPPAVVSEGWEAYKKEQEEMVEKYNLPYPLPNSATKVIDLEYTLTMKKKKKKNPPPASTSTSTPAPTPAPAKTLGHHDIESWKWFDANIVLAHEEWYKNWDVNIYGYWRHAAIYQGQRLFAGTNQRIIDAHPNGGVRVKDWNYWKTEYEQLGVYYYTPTGKVADNLPADTRVKIADKAASFIGKPYAVSTPKYRVDQFYCSQLIWKAYIDDFRGIDLDSNGGKYVFPDDISEGSNVVLWKNSTRYWQ